MLFRFLHKNDISIVILAPFLVLALWLRFFFVDIVHITSLDNPAMPLWDAFVLPYFGYSKYTAATGTFLLALLTGFSVNRMVARYGMLQHQSMMPLLIFGLLSGAFLSVQKLNPVWFFVFFFVLAIERLFATVNQRNHAVGCFDAAFLLGVGSLFYAKGLFFLPILIVTIGILRIGSLSSLVASFFGLLFPFVASFVYYFYFEKGVWFILVLKENLITNPGQYNHTVVSHIYMSFVIAILAVSILSVVRYMSVQKVIVRFYFRVFIWIILLAGAAVLTPFFSMELIPLAAVGASVTVAFWLERIKSVWIKEIGFLLLVCLTVIGQFFLY
ncbi:LTA synthase family protein [Alkaliflexus imshenetskii]|uniref:hypothetical protein n=1 Tax=Alkaliflexus imshenetskii TaxID=286730 RepID=UPI0004790207|nr:hypothetical protein [Alkaliflexus imshenetskii]